MSTNKMVNNSVNLRSNALYSKRLPSDYILTTCKKCKTTYNNMLKS